MVTIDDWVRQNKEVLLTVARAAAGEVADRAQVAKGKGGRMPVDTGFLRASGQSSLLGRALGLLHELSVPSVVADNVGVGAGFTMRTDALDLHPSQRLETSKVKIGFFCGCANVEFCAGIGVGENRARGDCSSINVSHDGVTPKLFRPS